jgi:hypothetical protein
MKAKIISGILFSLLYSIHGNGQDQQIKRSFINSMCCDEGENICTANDLEFQNLVLKMELDDLAEAYNYLWQKLEQKKQEALQYQKLIQQNAIIPLPDMSCVTAVMEEDCGFDQSFLEPILPITANYNSRISYFISDHFKQNLIRIFNENEVEIIDCQIERAGYGQVTIRTDELKYGTYNCRLFVDGRIVDSRKMVLLR